jgi:MFS transporter, FHS family, glucose/mannose:H+ symporter
VSTSSAQKSEKFFPIERPRDWVSGFLLLGVLLGATGSLSIAWQYHIDTHPQLIGLHFLGLNAGYVLAASVSRSLLRRLPIRHVMLGGCAIGVVSLLSLSFLGPPVPAGWRIAGLGFIGFAAGGIATSLFYALEPYFSNSAADAVNLAGALFGSGCTLATLVVGATYLAGSVQMETALLAVMPTIFFVVFLLSRSPAALNPVRSHQETDTLRKTLGDLRGIAAILFSLLLFFQSGNEWVIAGWLPLFLVHRLGANPVWAIATLAAYFLALTAARIAARRLLGHVSRRKLLVGGTALAMAGYLLLSFTSSMAGAWPAVIAIGAGFAPIYPLVSEILDSRFSYHPGFYNGVFSIAVTGAMSTPWLISYVDLWWGTQYLMLIPAFGSVVVFALILSIMFEANLMGVQKEDGDALSMAAAAGKK